MIGNITAIAHKVNKIFFLFILQASSLMHSHRDWYSAMIAKMS